MSTELQRRMNEATRKELQERAAYLLPFVQAAADGKQILNAASDTIAFPITGYTWYSDVQYKIAEEDGE